jgi:hypothetical protein
MKSLHRILKDLEVIVELSGFNALPEGAVDPSQKTLAVLLSKSRRTWNCHIANWRKA